MPCLQLIIYFLLALKVACLQSLSVEHSPPTLSITIRNSQGFDITSQIPIHHHHHKPLSTSPSLQSRATSISLNTCTDPTAEEFISSTCNHDISPQHYIILCRGIKPYDPSATMAQRRYDDLHPYKWVYTQDECAATHICVDSYNYMQTGLGRRSFSVAHCVETSSFVRIAKGNFVLDGAVPGSGSDGAGSEVGGDGGGGGGGGGENWSVEAVVTGVDNTTSAVAERLEVEALRGIEVGGGGTVLWGSMINGSVVCAGCASVLLPAVPVGAQKIRTEVVLPDQVVGLGALLFVVSVAW